MLGVLIFKWGNLNIQRVKLMKLTGRLVQIVVFVLLDFEKLLN